MSAAIQLAFLMDGFNQSHKWQFGHGAEGDKYETHADAHNGYIGIVADMEQYGQVVHELMSRESTNHEFPGVFEYEITEDLGKWLFAHPEHFNDMFVPLEFNTYALGKIRSWFNPNQPPVVEATSPEESNPMKLSSLIEQLTAILEDKGDYDVLTRGSEAQKMVDADNVRVVKTKLRTAVFIGKVKPEAS